MPGNNNIISLAFKLAQRGIIKKVDWDTDENKKRMYRFEHRGQMLYLTAAQAKPYFEALVREYEIKVSS